MDGTDSNTWGESFWPHSGLGTSLWLSAGFPEGYGLTYLGRTTLRSASDRVVPSRGPFREPTMVDPLGIKLSSSISLDPNEPLGTNPVGKPRSGIRATTRARGSIYNKNSSKKLTRSLNTWWVSLELLDAIFFALRKISTTSNFSPKLFSVHFARPRSDGIECFG